MAGSGFVPTWEAKLAPPLYLPKKKRQGGNCDICMVSVDVIQQTDSNIRLNYF